MWDVEIHRGAAAQFHSRDMPSVIEPAVWWFEVRAPALVLGSAQPASHVDDAECAARGIEVVRRRSGGGAVLLEPGDALWADVLLPAADPRWTGDVSRSAWWLGEVWQSALGAIGEDGLTVHRGPMVRTEWSDHVCFAGVGGGEVMRGGAKVVGISQRRTRAGVRFQCALYRHWRPEAHVPLFATPGPSVDDLAGCAHAVDVDPSTLMAAFLTALRA
ncbi:MAG: hypothetical protein JWN39_4403 [Ilumatobacteraceae bacterium]|nr:hypothetical protein [Ilumatobacteraceae bacterium]